jgi:hypothetical protein
MANAACGRPSFEAAKSELASLVEPAATAAVKGKTNLPEPLEDISYCSDPFLGPSDGVRSTMRYLLPLSVLGEDAESFVKAAEKQWRDRGLDIEADESEIAYMRFASKPGFNLSASVNYENQEAIISGNGPCVDDPNPEIP